MRGGVGIELVDNGPGGASALSPRVEISRSKISRSRDTVGWRSEGRAKRARWNLTVGYWADGQPAAA